MKDGILTEQGQSFSFSVPVGDDVRSYTLYPSFPIDDLKPFDGNPRNNEDAVDPVANSIKQFGFNNLIVTGPDFRICAGHTRIQSARELNMTTVPILVAEHLVGDDFTAYNIADNKTADIAEFDDDALGKLLAQLSEADDDDALARLTATGFDGNELTALVEGIENDLATEPTGSLADRFGVPPFTVLDARKGYWQDRKRAWLALGLDSKAGRDAKGLLMASASGKDVAFYKRKRQAETQLGYKLTTKEFTSDYYNQGDMPYDSGTSIFDPVLCELIYRWFAPDGGTILDPFAGGSVRGIVAERLGYKYTGIDLSQDQVDANMKQGADICDTTPEWIVGDSAKIPELVADRKFDFVFSCPPYSDLEKYSDDPADLSNMPYSDFVKLYREIIAHSCDRLADNSFACFVVGDIRDKRGLYRNFVGDTVQAFIDAGLHLYNEAILVTAVAALAMRAGRQFTAGRKLAKGHQNILVFYKGDPKKIKPLEYDEEQWTSILGEEAELNG